MIQNNNPWPGVMSYQIPGATDKEYVFCGRNQTVEDFLPLVERYDMTTLYGKSGVGKTSFLNAGIFPELQREGFLPIYIRLGLKSATDETTFAQTIVESLAEQMDAYSMIDYDWRDKAEGAKSDYLWRYFHTHRFKAVDSDGDFQTPVIILDQFEEVFGFGEQNTGVLLKQLYELIADNLSLPSAEGWFADTTVRIIISIREDYLFYLEDNIDRLHLPVLKDNRYRLRPMSKEEATDVVLLPGREFIKEDEQEKVAQNIVNAALQQGGEVNSLMLSLICHQLYEQLKTGEKITAQMTTSVDTSLQDYYKEAVSGLPELEREYIENYLVRDEHRRRVDYRDFLDNVPHGEYLLGEISKPTTDDSSKELTNKKYKLLSRIQASGEDYQIEIVHDQFARVITQMRREMRLERERQRRQRFIEFSKKAGVIAGLLLFIALLLIVMYYPKKVTLEDCLIKESGGYIISDAQDAESEDGVFHLNNVKVGTNAFRGNRNIKTLYVGSDVQIDRYAFDDCLNLEKIVFTGKNIKINAGAFGSQSKVKNIVVTKEAEFSEYENSSWEFPNLELIEVEQGNEQCVLDPTGEAMMIRMDGMYNGLIVNDYHAKLPRAWKPLIDNYHDNYIWCDTINLLDLVRDGYQNKDKYWYLVDHTQEKFPQEVYDKFHVGKKGTIPNFGKHVLIADLSKIDSIPGFMFHRSELRWIKAPEAKVIGHLAFYESKHLREYDFPNVVYTYQNIFRGCKHMNEIVFPSLENTYDLSLSLQNRVKRIYLPNLRILNSRALSMDTISKVILPSVDSINEDAFWRWAIDSLYITPRAKLQCEKFLSKQFKEARSDIDTLCLFVHVGLKTSYTLKELLQEDNKVPFYNNMYIKQLIIAEDDTADYRFDADNYLERIICSPKNKKYFVLNNTLYKHGEWTPVIFAQNSKQVVFLDYKRAEHSYYLKEKDNVETIILNYKWDIRLLNFADTKNDILILFPYGSESFMEGLNDLPKNIHIKEVSLVRSMWYYFKFSSLLDCVKYPWLPVLLLILACMIGSWPLIRKQVVWRSKQMWIYAAFYIVMVLIGWFVTVSTPIHYIPNLWLRYVWTVLGFIVAMSFARMLSKSELKAIEVLNVFLNVLITLLSAYFVLKIANDYRDPKLGNISDVSVLFGLIVVVVIKLVVRRWVPLQKRQLYSKRHVYFGLLSLISIIYGITFFLAFYKDNSFIGILFQIIGVILPLGAVFLIYKHRRIDKQMAFVLRKYAESRQLVMGSDLKFLSDKLTQKRMRVVFGVIVAYIVEFYVLLFISAESNINITDNGIGVIIYSSCILGIVIAENILSQKHLKYKDIVKQYKAEEKLMEEIIKEEQTIQ